MVRSNNGVPMSDSDWYRSSDWSPAAQQDFEQRLRRARYQKWNYLNIKAGFLMRVASTRPAGYVLQQRVIEGCDNPTLVACVHQEIAQQRLADGELNLAESAFRTAIELRRTLSNLDTPGADPRIELAELLLHRKPPRADEAIRLLREIDSKTLFIPAEQLRYATARARSAARLGDRADAKRHAAAALAISAREPASEKMALSGIRAQLDAKVRAQLRRLAE